MRTQTIPIWILSACLLFSGCAPLLAAREAELDLPAHYPQQPATPDNSAATAWDVFMADPTLIELIDTALAHNQEIKILRQEIQLAQNEVGARSGELLPFVRLKGGAELSAFNHRALNPRFPQLTAEGELELPEADEDLPGLSLGAYLNWELDVWQRLRQRRDAAQLKFLAAREGQTFMVTRLVAEIAVNYYDLLALDNKLLQLQNSIQIQQEILAIIQKLQQAARANALAVKRFEAEVQKNQSQIYQIRQTIAETENKLNYLLGRQPRPILRQAERFASLQIKALSGGLPSQLLINRADVRQAEHRLVASKLDLAAARTRFYPSFDMNAGLGYQAFNPMYLASNPQALSYNLAVEMHFPLVNQSAVAAEYQNASAEQIQAAYLYEQTLLKAYQEVADQLARIRNLGESYRLKSQQVENLNRSIEMARDLFRYARADYMEVLLTQREAIDARMELIETRQEQLHAMVELYQALGGGWQARQAAGMDSGG
ncbi:MAG: TolC family protein [Candidatus Sericytochromatia bacterium]|nr:TolC family protein [Candidatus Sericytochromatia bacterium]